MSEQQLCFPWGLESHEVADLAEKSMQANNGSCEVYVYRWISAGIWVVGKLVPVIGPSGYVGGAFLRMSPRLFFSGTEAWNFAKANTGKVTSCMNFPWIDQTMQ